MRYFIAALAIICSACSAFADIRLSNPRVNGRPLDWFGVSSRQNNAERPQPSGIVKCEIWDMLSASAVNAPTSGLIFWEPEKFAI